MFKQISNVLVKLLDLLFHRRFPPNVPDFSRAYPTISEHVFARKAYSEWVLYRVESSIMYRIVNKRSEMWLDMINTSRGGKNIAVFRIKWECLTFTNTPDLPFMGRSYNRKRLLLCYRADGNSRNYL